MTEASAKRIFRLYEAMIGYDPSPEGVTGPEALQTLREFRVEVRAAQASGVSA